jgi:hypothetical protein
VTLNSCRSLLSSKHPATSGCGVRARLDACGRGTTGAVSPTGYRRTPDLVVARPLAGSLDLRSGPELGPALAPYGHCGLGVMTQRPVVMSFGHWMASGNSCTKTVRLVTRSVWATKQLGYSGSVQSAEVAQFVHVKPMPPLPHNVRRSARLRQMVQRAGHAPHWPVAGLHTSQWGQTAGQTGPALGLVREPAQPLTPVQRPR